MAIFNSYVKLPDGNSHFESYPPVSDLRSRQDTLPAARAALSCTPAPVLSQKHVTNQCSFENAGSNFSRSVIIWVCLKIGYISQL